MPAPLHEAVARVLTLEDQARVMTAMLRDECELCDADDPDRRAMLKIIVALGRERWQLIHKIAGSLP